jgi:hypothetical protein
MNYVRGLGLARSDTHNMFAGSILRYVERKHRYMLSSLGNIF